LNLIITCFNFFVVFIIKEIDVLSIFVVYEYNLKLMCVIDNLFKW